MKILNLILLTLFVLLFASCEEEQFKVKVVSDQEEIAANGYRYTPSTQSFLRGHHWLEGINEASITFDKEDIAHLDFDISKKGENYISVKNVKMNQLVPRLHYQHKGEPDRFDLFNLMLAEYSRNGLSFPYGHEGDRITHFETNLEANIPWVLKEDYDFKPNPAFKPIRFSIVNNCLEPGLWEMNASDKTGEVYHSWFSFPKDKYFDLVGKVNKISSDKVSEALKWNDEPVKLDLDRLRTIKHSFGEQAIAVVDEEISYSSQGSRRKLSAGFVTCKLEDEFVRPKKLSDLLKNPVKMAQFEPPGKYSINNKMEFNFQDFEKPQGVTIREVDPLTSFSFDKKPYKRDKLRYIEMEIILPNKRKLIIGNLPLNLLVQQEDFTLHGFGVGILSAGGFAERRQFLLEQGFHPSYAYLAEETPNGTVAVNSHGQGIEQIFIRSYAKGDVPHWDVTVTSYERITDIVKYRIPINPELIRDQIAHNDNYITPVYFSYRDDNLR